MGAFKQKKAKPSNFAGTGRTLSGRVEKAKKPVKAGTKNKQALEDEEYVPGCHDEPKSDDGEPGESKATRDMRYDRYQAIGKHSAVSEDQGSRRAEAPHEQTEESVKNDEACGKPGADVTDMVDTTRLRSGGRRHKYGEGRRLGGDSDEMEGEGKEK